MLTYLQAIILGLLQGVTELFPISSLGHSVILPGLLQWNLDQNADQFLVFLVATHLATALVLVGFFFKDWLRIAFGMLRSLQYRSIQKAGIYAKLGWLIVVSTIPAGLLGLLFEKKLRALFILPLFVAIVLTLNGLLLFLADHLRKKATAIATTRPASSDETIAALNWRQATLIGLAQTLALIPGFSRTGSTIGGGLFVGLHHANAARYSFLLATPIIFAAAVLKLPELATPQAQENMGPTLVGALCAALAAYLSVKFLTRYFQTNTLRPFAIYCTLAGALSVLIFLLRL